MPRATAPPDDEGALGRWAWRALIALAFALAWWLRFAGEDDDGFGESVVDTLRWFAGGSLR